nr:anti-sigma factor [Streptomonospora sp. PA3]
MPEHDVHGLTAGYAVDALSGEERERARRHIEECADCRRDLADFRATAVRLAYAQSERPADAVWERLRATVPTVRQLPPETADSLPAAEQGAGAQAPPRPSGESGGGGAQVVGMAGRGRLRRRLPWLLAAACAVLVLVLGGTVLAMAQRMQEMSEHSAKVEALLAASDTSMSEEPVSHSRAQATVFASERSDMVMVVVKGLPPTPEGMGYQLWYVDDSGMRSAGMLERTDEGVYSGMAGDMGSAEQLGISMEPAGGMPEPSKEPMKVEL